MTAQRGDSDRPVSAPLPPGRVGPPCKCLYHRLGAPLDFEPTPAPSTKHDTEQLRDELVSTVEAEMDALGFTAADIVDAVLALPAVRRLVAERDEARAQVQRVRELRKAWEDDTRHWYYENRYTHENGIEYVAGYEDGWNHADELLGRALDGPPPDPPKP